MFKYKKVASRFLVLSLMTIGFGITLLSEVQAKPYCPKVCQSLQDGSYLACESVWVASLKKCFPTTNCDVVYYNACPWVEM